jgi:hypothetical protein
LITAFYGALNGGWRASARPVWNLFVKKLGAKWTVWLTDMAEYSHEDAEYAAKVVESLFVGEAEGLELESDVVISDVESDANAFSEDLTLLQELNANVPALVIANEAVPVSLVFVFRKLAGWSLFPPFFHMNLYKFLLPLNPGFVEKGYPENIHPLRNFRFLVPIN